AGRSRAGPRAWSSNALTLSCEEMGRSRGLEPPTPGTTNKCSNQLSYDRHGAGRERFPCPRGALRRRRRGTQGAVAPHISRKLLINVCYVSFDVYLAPLSKEAHRDTSGRGPYGESAFQVGNARCAPAR